MNAQASHLTVEQKLAAGGMLAFREEFCPWMGIGTGTAYNEVKAGRLNLTKIGRKTVVAAADALAYRKAVLAASSRSAA